MNQPVVIDNGSGVMKSGFAGQDTPSCTFPTLVGRPKHDKLMIGGLTSNEVFVGNEGTRRVASFVSYYGKFS